VKRAALIVIVVLAAIMFIWQFIKTVAEIRNSSIEWVKLRKIRRGASRPPAPFSQRG
jgi:uncharacterized protein HemY